MKSALNDRTGHGSGQHLWATAQHSPMGSCDSNLITETVVQEMSEWYDRALDCVYPARSSTPTSSSLLSHVVASGDTSPRSAVDRTLRPSFRTPQNSSRSTGDYADLANRPYTTLLLNSWSFLLRREEAPSVARWVVRVRPGEVSVTRHPGGSG